MKDEKEPLEQKQNSEEEEYSFLQEIIKDEAGDQAKWKHDVLRRNFRKIRKIRKRVFPE